MLWIRSIPDPHPTFQIITEPDPALNPNPAPDLALQKGQEKINTVTVTALFSSV